MGRSQRHKIEEQGYTSRGEIYEQGAINDQILKAVGGAIAAARPVLTSINPATAVCNSAPFTLHALGSLFDANTSIFLNGKRYGTSFLTAGDISCSVSPSLFLTPQTVTVQVVKGASLPSSATKSLTFTAT